MGVAFSQTAKSKIVLPTSPVSVIIRNVDSKETTTKSLCKAMQERCPTLFQDFVPAWWMNSGHLQTLYCVVGDFTKTDKVMYDRTYIRLRDSGTIGLDFTPPEGESLRDDTPIIVVLHGLTGGSHESYVRSILSNACAPVEQGGLGYRGIVVNFRGCAGTPITAQQFYSAGWTDDLRQALMYIAHRYPSAPLHGLGFSLGANVIVRYLAEEKEQSRLSTACVLGCPWNLALNNEALEHTFIGRHLYSKGMANNLLRLLRRHTYALSKDPDHAVTYAMRHAFSLKSPTLEQFDDVFTCKAGGGSPPFPLNNSAEYYEYASSHHVLPEVGTPLLTVNAADDPVVRKVPTGVDNPNVVMVVTSGGGHLGWFEATTGGYIWCQPTRWITKPVLEWLRFAGTDMVVQQRGRDLFVGEDGYIRESGNDHLGCKMIDGGGMVEGATKDDDLIQGL